MPKKKALIKPLTQKFSFNKTSILIVAALVAIVGAAYVFITRASGPYVFFTPASGTIYNGSTFNVAVYEDSTTAAVNAVETDFTYPASKLQFVSINRSTSNFNLTARAGGGNGNVYISAASAGTTLTGKQLVGIVTFKVIAGGGQSAALNFSQTSAIITAATPSTNILSYTQGSTYLLQTATPSITISPITGTFAYSTNANVIVNLNEQSGTSPVNAFQGVLDYPASLLQYDHVTYSSGFTQAALPNINNGKLTVVAADFGGRVTGLNKIVTVYFRVRAAGIASLKIDPASTIVNANTSQLIPITTGSAKYTLTKP